MNWLKNKKIFKTKKVIISIIIVVLCAIGVGVAISLSKKNPPKINTMTIKKEIGTINNDISDYFTSNSLAKPFWYYKTDETAWSMSYKKNSVIQDKSNKEKLIATIDLKNSSTKVTKSITINLDWLNPGSSKDTEWKEITSEITNLGYHNKNDSPAISDVKNYIDNWLLTDKNTWYETFNNHEITFIAGDVKINSDGEFTTTLKPNNTIDGNKDVPLALKWMLNDDLKPNNIISAIKTAGYSNAPVLIWSMVKKNVSDYLANIAWAIKPKTITNDLIVPEFHLIATKVVKDKDSNWIVTIDQKPSLKIRNLDFKPFDIILDWKNQNDTTDKIKLSEIDIQIESNNYTKTLSADDVRILFNNFLISGKWSFTGPWDNQWRQAQPLIDVSTDGQGVRPSPDLTDHLWNISLTFKWINAGSGRNEITYWGLVGLKWQFAAPDPTEITKNVLHQLNVNPDQYFFTYTPNH